GPARSPRRPWPRCARPSASDRADRTGAFPSPPCYKNPVGERTGAFGGSPRSLAVGAVVSACLALTAASPAWATNINVTTTSDESADNATCSLREAVTAANTNSNAHENACNAGWFDTDVISLPAGTYTLSGSGDDTNATGDLDVTGLGPIQIKGTSDAE